MAASSSAPIALDHRIELIDVLRGLAVGGILIGNMQWFSGYGIIPEVFVQSYPATDHITRFLVHFFVEGKFYSIFSFLFGFGFALQMSRAEDRGDSKRSVFKRRLAWLFVIGALHATLLWAGDILSVYAVMGFILLLFRNKSDESLLKCAFWLMVVPVVTYFILYGLFAALAPTEVMATIEEGKAGMWTDAQQVVGHGSWTQILREFNLQMLAGRWAGLIIQMRLPKILAMFLLGFWAYRKGIFQNLEAHRPLIKKVLLYGLALGLIGNIALAALAGNEAPFPPTLAAAIGVFGYAFGVPAMALGIIALVSLLWLNGWQKLLAVVAPVGRMALTNYLLQTVTCVTIFYGYGFGRFGTIGAARATLIALGIFATQIVLSTIWLRFFAYGPVEWLWRQLTYRRRLPLRT